MKMIEIASLVVSDPALWHRLVSPDLSEVLRRRLTP